MNYKKIQKAARFIAVAVGLATAGTAWGAEFWLRSGITTNTLPDGRMVAMWGFALDSSDGAGDGIITVPGPQLNVASNDTLIIHVQNTLPEPVSIVIPGQYNYQVLDPVFHSGGAYDGRVRSLTHEAAAGGGKATYVWTSVQPGTFLYHTASHPSVQVQMGLYGALSVVVPGPAVYGGMPFASSATLLFSEIDPDVHDAVSGAMFGAGPAFRQEDFTNAAAVIAQLTVSTDPVAVFVAGQLSGDPASLASDLNAIIGGPSIYDPTLFPDTVLAPATLELLSLTPPPSQNYPTTGIPFRGDLVRMNRLMLQDGLANAGIPIPPVMAMTSTIRSHAQYFMINGQCYTNGQLPIAAGKAGSAILLRLLNAGMDAHVPTLNNGGDFRLIGEDGQQAPYGRNASAAFLPALKTLDALWTPASAGTYAIYDRRLGLVNGMQSPGGMLAFLSVIASNAVSSAPTVLIPPANAIAFVGQSATFSVIASHVGALTYQWRLNGTNITGATAASYAIAAVAAANRGSYTVVVTEGAASTTSAAATLTVLTQPAPVTVTDGASATFTVTDLGPAAVTYQWRKDGVAISGATNASYTFVANYATDNGHLYSVVANGPGGPATSANALLTVTPVAPVIVTQPANQTVADFTTATFSVVASGSGLTYQWQRSPTLAGAFVNIAGATGASYSFQVTYATDNNSQYRVIVSRSGILPATSVSATLTVTPVGPQILTQPVNTAAHYGVATNLTVVARASGTLTYLWQKFNGTTWVNVSGTGISGTTTATLTFNATATANTGNSGSYRVTVTSTGAGAGSVISSTAVFTVAPAAPIISAQPVSIVTNAGALQVTFTVVAVGYPAPTYQWQRYNGVTWVNLANGGTLGYAGVNTPTLTIASGAPVITVVNAGSYRAVLSNLGGVVNSAAATLTVVQTFTGAAVTSIPLAGGTASLYPALSTSVPAFTGSSVKHATVSLTLTDVEPYDVSVLLTTPTPAFARKVELMSGLGPVQQEHEVVVNNVNVVTLYSYPVSNMVLTFDDAAPTPAPTLYPLFAGTFQPTVRTPGVAFPAPAPALPYATNLTSFVGYNQPAAGGWRLYVNDIAQDIPATGSDGRISAWSLTLTVGP